MIKSHRLITIAYGLSLFSIINLCKLFNLKRVDLVTVSKIITEVTLRFQDSLTYIRLMNNNLEEELHTIMFHLRDTKFQLKSIKILHEK